MSDITQKNDYNDNSCVDFLIFAIDLMVAIMEISV
mgnify:CR=1 FL=1|jgi:hypothetical protein